jgi:hypothetical protein
LFPKYEKSIDEFPKKRILLSVESVFYYSRENIQKKSVFFEIYLHKTFDFFIIMVYNDYVILNFHLRRKNMADFVLSCTTHIDLPKEYADSRNLYYTTAPYFMDGKEFRDDFYQCMSAEEFYKAMVDGVDVKTSQPNIQEFLEYFESILKEGKDILT